MTFSASGTEVALPDPQDYKPPRVPEPVKVTPEPKAVKPPTSTPAVPVEGLIPLGKPRVSAAATQPVKTQKRIKPEDADGEQDQRERKRAKVAARAGAEGVVIRLDVEEGEVVDRRAAKVSPTHAVPVPGASRGNSNQPLPPPHGKKKRHVSVSSSSASSSSSSNSELGLEDFFAPPLGAPAVPRPVIKSTPAASARAGPPGGAVDGDGAGPARLSAPAPRPFKPANGSSAVPLRPPQAPASSARPLGPPTAPGGGARPLGPPTAPGVVARPLGPPRPPAPAATKKLDSSMLFISKKKVRRVKKGLSAWC